LTWNDSESKLTFQNFQIIARRHPELNVHDLVRCISPTDVMETSSETALGTFGRNSRVSAYDNVDKQNNHSGYASSFLNSAQSDDGTVFSEPWDSSQWDSFLPNDDAGSDTIHLSKCRSALGQSEDDTIVEDHSSATLTRHESNNNHTKGGHNEGKGYLAAQNNKVATIVRNRSCRDREVLCEYKYGNSS
jgi:Ras and Rab interactor 2/3